MSESKPNLEQQKIINYINKSILVLALVGSGKTLVLSQKVVQAIKSGISACKNALYDIQKSRCKRNV